jgi:hypothetical protein
VVVEDLVIERFCHCARCSRVARACDSASPGSCKPLFRINLRVGR